MDKAELEGRIADFDYTVNVCEIRLDGPEELLELLYEDFAVYVGTFFHPINLDILLHAGIITEEVKHLCVEIEAKVDYLTQNPTIVERIKGNSRWEAVFALCEQVRYLRQPH
jgi:hypothetical protein